MIILNKTLKKLLIVTGLTGLGHALSVSLYPIATRFLSKEEMVSISLIDSTIMLLVAFLGFGLNATTTRDIALHSNWKTVLAKAQSARITLSLLFSLFGFIWYLLELGQFEIGLLFILAPLFALNYDFALYGLGKPEAAAIVSFIRQSIPLSIFIVCIFLELTTPILYLFLVVSFVLFAAARTSKLASAKLLYRPSKSFYQVYIASIWVGLAGLLLVYQRFGFLTTIEARLSNNDFVLLATSLKVLLLVVACKRILIQVFYTKLLDDNFCQRLNAFCFSIGLLSLIISYYFSAELSTLLFNDMAAQQYAILIGVGACTLLSFSVSDSRLLLKNKDKWFFFSGLFSGGIFLSIVMLDIINLTNGVDYLSLLIIIEVILVILYRLGLIPSPNNK